MADVNKDENVSVARTNINLGGVIAAIALLLLVLGLLRYLGISPV